MFIAKRLASITKRNQWHKTCWSSSCCLQPWNLPNLISVQSTGRTRSSSLVTL